MANLDAPRSILKKEGSMRGNEHSVRFSEDKEYFDMEYYNRRAVGRVPESKVIKVLRYQNQYKLHQMESHPDSKDNVHLSSNWMQSDEARRKKDFAVSSYYEREGQPEKLEEPGLEEAQEQEQKAAQEREQKAAQEHESKEAHEQEREAPEQESKTAQEQEQIAAQEQELEAAQEQELEAAQEQELEAAQEQELEAAQELELGVDVDDSLWESSRPREGNPYKRRASDVFNRKYKKRRRTKYTSINDREFSIVISDSDDDDDA